MIKKLFLVLVICLISVVFFSPLVSAQEPKTTAAVIDLQAEEGVSQSVARMLSDYLRAQLFNTQKFIMVTRENMEQILKEQQFQLAGCTSEECIVQAGQLLGVRKMFTGFVGKVGTTYLITLKIIDVESGKIDRVETEECDKCEESALLISIKNITNKIIGAPAIITKKTEIPKGYAYETKWGIHTCGAVGQIAYEAAIWPAILTSYYCWVPYWRINGGWSPIYYGYLQRFNSYQFTIESLFNIPIDWWSFQFGIAYTFGNFPSLSLPVGFEFFYEQRKSFSCHLRPVFWMWPLSSVPVVEYFGYFPPYWYAMVDFSFNFYF
ncbi:hypothetical protein AUJ66_02585 [Candidatus Desantisbacteria bacterium CG1_02_38_46]|uniref:FlgO domain-containing protein n=2 Tax=unclassified Candidatus Desantisiibacteriota TaxID=3106372 RepID=A0A1J4SHQ0_9BACT|nr:MAG: hypothetical protein AUJ66_02585 [Candidatus Desantisbacteria bacterium CG1_02_38_46]PIU52084.1 MAG: hypothetical protein COS91_00970 [Candidatus Desantisbacteria bacterium CG07_land_8_20_14_0_80_39_15]